MSSHHSDTRNRILKASWKLLEAKKGTEVRMLDIAKRAGITRQALYLHFRTRSELLIATTRYLDEVKGIDERLIASRSAETGIERLDEFIQAWGNYIPEIYGIAKALLAVKDTDKAAAQAWNERMQAVRHGCAAVVRALRDDDMLSPDHSVDQATDILWTLLSVQNWEQLTLECGWSQEKFILTLKKISRRILVE